MINRTENKRQMNLKRGLILLLIGTVFTSISASIGKITMNFEANVYLYMFGTMLFGFFLSMLNHRRDLSKGNTYNRKHIKRI